MKIESMTMEQPIDLAEWRIYTLKTGLVALTSVGRQLFKQYFQQGRVGVQIMEEVAKYKDSYKRNLHSSARNYISKGSNGSVYQLGDTELVIKEGTNGISLYESISRMDTLKHIIDNYDLPKWIGMPEHYGIVEYSEKKESGSDASKKYDTVHTFMLIQRIDSGITVADILDSDTVVPEFRQITEIKIQRELGEVTNEEKKEIQNSLDEMLTLVRQKVVEAKQQNPKVETAGELLPDFHAGNILIERLVDPIDGKHFKYWIIDQ